jgi:hypothetical protein
MKIKLKFESRFLVRPCPCPYNILIRYFALFIFSHLIKKG